MAHIDYVLSAVFLLAASAAAKLAQNGLYTDDMILESREAYDIRPFIAGTGDRPGEQVTVEFTTWGSRGSHTSSYPTTVGQDGSWEVQMNCCDYLTNATLSVVGENNTLTYSNVACGQVFVCSGQSNMALPLSYVFNGTEEIAAANRPNWRLFTVPRTTSDTPLDDFTLPTKGWQVSTPVTAANFSATCYLTARHIADMYWGDAPIGLIQSAWGGTRVEAWTPSSVKKSCEKIEPQPPVLPGLQSYSSLYNAMIHPLVRYSIRGVLWFQGERNIVTNSTESLYACEFGGMINAWRDAWRGIGDFPFIWAQLAPYISPGDISTIRLAQSDTMPHIGLDTTGMAVTIDLGDPHAPLTSVHSRLKEPVARRLALQAMHVAYAFQEGENVTNYDHPQMTPHPFELHYSGPIVDSVSYEGHAVSISFNFGEGLYLNDTAGCLDHREKSAGKLVGGECCRARNTFQLCTGNGDANTLKCSNATIESISKTSNTITVTAANIPNPSHVRYAYANYPECALYNQYDLPAGPFVSAVQYTSSKKKPNQFKASDPTAPAVTPPMGLNSWNAFHCNVDERKMRAMADALVSTGLKKVGYEFVNIDDCWQVERSPNGSINADPVRFPGGIRALASYAHDLGLKFGVYTAQHQFTCQRRPGSYMHEAIDVESYCDWGVDYLKIDACTGAGYSQQNESWIKFRAAIDNCSAKRGYPIVMSVESCDDPTSCGLWIPGLANLWRTCGDIQGTFSSVMGNVAENTRMAAIAGPSGGPLGGGHWNDADMLQVGNVGLSIPEQISHFSLWSIMASPLLIGTDVSMLSNESLTILGNADATAINQDPLGKQGVPVGPGSESANTAPCWSKPLKNGDFGILLLNTGDNATTISCSLDDLGLPNGAKGGKDIWAKKPLDAIPKGGNVTAKLESHACMFAVLQSV